jgi:hypothetical protein
MRKTIVASTLALAAFAVGNEAWAAGGWGLHSGDTLRGGDNMVYGEFGWPSVALGFQHGMSSKVDLGFRLDLIYGLEYTTTTALGMGMRMPIRIAMAKGGKFSAMLHFDPGVKFDAFSFFGKPLFGIWLPLGLEFGIHIVPEATLQFGFDMPFYLNLTQAVYVGIPIQFGFGFEYKIDDHLGVGLNTRFGPSIGAGDIRGFGFSGVAFGFVTQAGFMYRF